LNDFIDQVLAVEAAAAIWRETQRSAHDVIVPREQAPKWQPLRPALQVSIVAVQPHLPTRSRASFNAEREFYKKNTINW